MKKLLLVTAIAVFGFSANAQDDEKVSTSKFGAKAGFNSTSLRVSFDGTSASESVSGFYLGVFGEFMVSEKFDIQPELQYVSVSEDGENSGFLLIPVLAKYNATEDLSILAGPQFDYLLDDEDGGLNRLGFGIAAGLAYNIDENFVIDARYSLGLSNRTTDGIEELEGFDFKTTFNYVQIGLGYKF
ncbi:MAG: OmpW family protein [Bacteroidetes bacterium]|nr:MAG: OmpW family protein [Bacteroidota bacterium]